MDTSSASDDKRMNLGDRYINFGLVAITGAPDLLRVRMDTWYYSIREHVGAMSLGSAGITAETGMPTFIADHLVHVLSGFGSFVRFRPTIRIGHMPTLESIRAYVAQFTAPTEKELLAKLQGWLQQTPDLVTLLLINFDLRLAVRTYEGEIVDQWLPSVGELRFAARLELDQDDKQTNVSTFAWQGELDLRVLSLFRRDNRAELRHARNLWKRFRMADPLLDTFPEEADEDPIVTLVEPPEGTPADNYELCTRNLTRLQAIIHHWEKATGSHFVWAAHIG